MVSIGYIFTLFGCSANWKAILQSIVALSIIESSAYACNRDSKGSYRVTYGIFGLQWQLTIMHFDS